MGYSCLVPRPRHEKQHMAAQALLDAGAHAWQQLTPKLLRTVCACPYLSHEIQA